MAYNVSQKYAMLERTYHIPFSVSGSIERVIFFFGFIIQRRTFVCYAMLFFHGFSESSFYFFINAVYAFTVFAFNFLVKK